MATPEQIAAGKAGLEAWAGPKIAQAPWYARSTIRNDLAKFETDIVIAAIDGGLEAVQARVVADFSTDSHYEAIQQYFNENGADMVAAIQTAVAPT